MTELSFLLSLLLDHKLTKSVKDLIKERIKEIEFKPSAIPPRAQVSIPVMSIQAPSTIANLMSDPIPQPMVAAPPLPPMPQKRIVGGEVSTGSGTRGPRKF